MMILHLFLVMTLFVNCFVPNFANSAAPIHKKLRGAVVGLLKGDKKSDFDQLVLRNKSLLKFMFSNETAHNPDVLLFHEGDFASDLQKYINEQTPELNIVYKRIQFTGHAIYNDSTNTTIKQVYPQCFPTFWSKQFKEGYRNMCRFWFMGVFEYVQEYDWLFRLDCDCELLDHIQGIMPDSLMSSAVHYHNASIGLQPFGSSSHSHNQQHVFISAPAWMPMHRQKYDKIATTKDGDVVLGMGNFVREFANRNGLNHSFIDSFNAPYTNAMFINLRWFRASGTKSHANPQRQSDQALIKQFMHEVDQSNCIYSNRWGDLPLWGAVLALVEHPVHFLNVPYYHQSHQVVIKPTSKSGFFRADIPYMLIYTDNVNSTMNTRISVKG